MVPPPSCCRLLGADTRDFHRDAWPRSTGGLSVPPTRSPISKEGMVKKTIGYTDIDFDKPGKQTGFLDLPYSPHGDAWGTIRIPLAVIANGKGPTVIFEGGNHGDEYEGPITLGEVIRDLDPATINGRLIIIPAINLPAVAAGTRTSPIDQLNFNRTFPGDSLGTPTQQISAYVNDHLFPLADAFIDLHSGGLSLQIIPSAIIEPAEDPAHLKRNIDAAVAFGAPMSVVIGNRGDPRTATASAVRAGLTAVGTEMAGAGTVTIEALAMCRRGVRNVLAHLGVMPQQAAPTPNAAPAASATPASWIDAPPPRSIRVEPAALLTRISPGLTPRSRMLSWPAWKSV